MPIGSMSIKITGDISDFNKSIASVQKQLNASTKGLQTVARSMSTVGMGMTKGITLPIIAIGAGLLKLGKDFDNAYDTIRAGTGATGDALDGLKTDFREIAKVAPSSFKDIGAVVADLNTRLGLTGKPLQDLSVQMLNFARITKTDINTLIPAATRVFGDWQIATDKQGKAMDTLFKVSQSTGIGVDRLSEKVVQLGAPLRNLGYSFEEATALMGKWEKEGVNTETVFSGLRQALRVFAKEGVTDTHAALMGLIEQMKNAGTTGEAATIGMDYFGKGLNDVADAARGGKFDIDELIKSVGDGTDTINAVSAATMDWKEKLILLRNNIGISLEPLAMKVFDSIGKGVDKVTPKIEALAKWFGNLDSGMQDSLITWALLLAAIGPVLLIIGKTTTAIIQLRTAILTMNVAMKASLLYAPEAILAMGLLALQTNSSAQAFKDFELVQAKLRDGMYLFSKAPEAVRIQMQFLQDEMAVLTEEGHQGSANYLKLKMIELSNQFLEGKITAEDLAYGLDLLHTSIIPSTVAMGELTDATVGQIIATQNNEATIKSLMEQTGKTREECLEYAKAQELLEDATDDTTEATDGQREEIDKLRSSFNKLIDDIFGGITTYNDFQEANWAVEAAQKALTEAIKKYGKGSQEAEKAQNNLDDANITAIETAFKLSNQIGATTEQQEEARKKAIDLGLQYVATGDISIEKFIEMAAQFGMSAKDIIDWADKENIKLDELTKDRIVNVETGRSISAVNLLEEALNRIHNVDATITITGVMAGQDLTHFLSGGGPVGFSGGGFLDKILSASQGMMLPKFDNGGVLAMLHPPEIVLNAKEAMQLVWNMAKQPITTKQSGEINNTYNITSPKPLSEAEIKRQIDLYSRDMGYRMGLN